MNVELSNIWFVVLYCVLLVYFDVIYYTVASRLLKNVCSLLYDLFCGEIWLWTLFWFYRVFTVSAKRFIVKFVTSLMCYSWTSCYVFFCLDDWEYHLKMTICFFFKLLYLWTNKSQLTKKIKHYKNNIILKLMLMRTKPKQNLTVNTR